MVPFYQPIHKKSFMQNVRGRKIILQAHTPRKKKTVWINFKGMKKIHAHTKSLIPPPPQKKRQNGWPLKSTEFTKNRTNFNERETCELVKMFSRSPRNWRLN